MINYNKFMKKLDDKGITTYVIRKKGLIPQSTLTKLKMCSGDSMDQIEDVYKRQSSMCGLVFILSFLT